MFGYVKTDFANLYVKDTVLYKAMYCGLCKSIGCACGQKARLVLNYDLTFLSVLLHNVLGIDVKIEKQHCIIHTIRKRPVALPDELSKRIGALNVILAHHKLSDDVIDSGKGKIKRSFFKSAYKKAKRQEPIIDKIVESRYQELLTLEKQNCNSIDMVAHPFGIMMQDIVEHIAGEKCSDQLKEISYNLGKWIYLIDALDDFDKDIKSKNFNVFKNAYEQIDNKDALLKQKGQEIVIVFSSVLSRIGQLAQQLEYKFNHDLLDNVLLRGLSFQTKQIMENKKCENITKF